jgi:hypothetical protein
LVRGPGQQKAQGNGSQDDQERPSRREPGLPVSRGRDPPVGATQLLTTTVLVNEPGRQDGSVLAVLRKRHRFSEGSSPTALRTMITVRGEREHSPINETTKE